MPALPLLALLYPTLLLSSLNTLQSNSPTSENYFIFADESGTPYVVEVDDKPLTEEDIHLLESDLDRINFRLYTRNNGAGQDLSPIEPNTIKNSDWDPKRPTRIITHGWRGDMTTKSCTGPRDAYLEVGDYNVIVIDWSVIANSLMYGTVAKSVPIVANYVALFIDVLEYEGLNPSTTKMVGHSLGAHLMSLAARNARSTMAEVVALDPARPSFENADPGSRVDASDAKHVQVIHTGSGMLGMMRAVGTSDFYPNGGTNQPGCPIYDVIGACSHSRSYLYFAESIRNSRGFRGTPTDNFDAPSQSNKSAYMGGPSLDLTAKGPYELNTNSQAPFAQG